MPLDTPVNIHLTGCHHSCAQHFVSEIGLLACKVEVGEDADPVEGYHLLIGGGFGPYAALGRELYRDVKAEDTPKTIERVLKTYLAHRAIAARKASSPLRAGMRSTRSRPWSNWRRWNEHHARPPIPSLIPESAPFTPEQRTWLNGLFAGMISLEESVTPLSNAAGGQAVAGPARSRRARGRRRRRALARSGHAAARPHEARRRQAAAAADDGGDGAAGLQPVRL